MSATEWLLRERRWVYSPIVHCHQLATEYGLPRDAKFWQDYNRAMLDAAAGMYVLLSDGWKASIGMKLEIIRAIERDIAIVEVLPGDESDLRVPWKFGTGKYFVR
jgi:hypothetical protein